MKTECFLVVQFLRDKSYTCKVPCATHFCMFVQSIVTATHFHGNLKGTIDFNLRIARTNALCSQSSEVNESRA